MIRGFFRLLGLLLLAGGFIFMVYDGARWVADQTLRFTRFGQFWNDVHQSSQRAFQVWVEHTAPLLWTSVVKVILEQPGSACPPRCQPFRQRPSAAAALSPRPGAGGVRARLFLGSGAQVLGTRRWHLYHGRGLRRRSYRQPHL